jgi:steroid delta-isomerase-like uncharacterized protein
MTAEGNKAVVRRYFEEVLNEGNIDLLDELAVPDFEEHDPLPGQGTGIDGLKDRVGMLRDGLAPRFTIDDLIAEGDKVVIRWTNAGTHVGEFLGAPPTGKSFKTPGINIFRVKDGKMTESWHVVDVLGQLQQLGLVPGPDGANA